jgi:hypothetical protein
MFSRRTELPRETNPLTRRVAARQASGAELLDLTESNPTRAGIAYHPDVVTAMGGAEGARYQPEPFGLPSARQAVAALLAEQGTPMPAERVVLTASTSEAYAFLFKLLCDPGDSVLVPAPSYPLLEHLGRLESIALESYPLGYDGAWHIDLGALRRAVGPRTRAIVLVSPNNPTGNYLHAAELASLSELGLPLISDEVFASYPLLEDPARVPSVLSQDGVVAFALGGLSKLAALPQMKLAWIGCTGPDAQVAEALSRLEIVADAFLSLATPVQHALPALLGCRGVASDAIRARTRQNLSQLRRALVGSAANVLHVEGGWYATVRLPESQDDEAWALDLLDSEGVLLQPGYFFDFPPGAFLVVSLLTGEPVLAEGAERLARHVARRTT